MRRICYYRTDNVLMWKRPYTWTACKQRQTTLENNLKQKKMAPQWILNLLVIFILWNETEPTEVLPNRVLVSAYVYLALGVTYHLNIHVFASAVNIGTQARRALLLYRAVPVLYYIERAVTINTNTLTIVHHINIGSSNMFYSIMHKYFTVHN